MKIAMIIDAWEPIIGGGQIHVKNLCEKLILNHNCEVDLFVRALKDSSGKTFHKNETLCGGKLRIIRCGKPALFFNFTHRITTLFLLSLNIIKENKNKHYHIIHAHSFLPLLSGKIAASYLKLPIISTVHGSNLLDCRKYGFYYLVEKILLTKIRYDWIISVGESFLKYKNINSNISVIGNGVNLYDFDNVRAEKEKSYFKILFVGRFEWTKGIDTLIEAIELLGKKFLYQNKIKIELIGYGYDEIKYKQLVLEKKLEDFIVFRGKIKGSELIAEYKRSNLYILPSRTEGFGMTLIESMASKTLVLATRCGGPEDIIKDGINGYLVQKENPQKLAERMRELVLQNNQEEIISHAFNMVKEKYTWDIVANSTFEIYLKLK